MSRARVTVDRGVIEAARTLLGEDESLREFIEVAIRKAVDNRQAKAEFLSRGLAARARARRSGNYRDSESVLAELEAILRAKEATRNPR